MFLINKFREWIDMRAAMARMPKEVKDWWYCGKWIMYDGPENKKEIKPPYEKVFCVFPPDVTGKRTYFHPEVERPLEGSVSGLPEVPGIKVNGYVGIYAVERRYRQSAWYDGAPWDDGYHADFRLVRVIPERQWRLEEELRYFDPEEAKIKDVY